MSDVLVVLIDFFNNWIFGVNSVIDLQVRQFTCILLSFAVIFLLVWVLFIPIRILWNKIID